MSFGSLQVFQMSTLGLAFSQKLPACMQRAPHRVCLSAISSSILPSCVALSDHYGIIKKAAAAFPPFAKEDVRIGCVPILHVRFSRRICAFVRFCKKRERDS